MENLSISAQQLVAIARSLVTSPRILIHFPTRLIDVLRALPVLCALRDRYPGAIIAGTTSATPNQLLQTHACLNQVLFTALDACLCQLKRGRLGQKKIYG